MRRSLLVFAAIGAACAGTAPARARPRYVPRTRELTVTTVPLLVRESQRVYPFLARDFAPRGVLEGKEVYAFSPSTLTVVEGDTVHFTLVNPEDDVHSFVLPDCVEDEVGSFVPPDCGVQLPAQQVTHATYVARRAGVYPILCTVARHLPMMSGQLVVIPAATMTGGTEGGNGAGGSR
jgi:plastocyanin